ncbi:MAG: methyltransferase domain-containing protein [Polyangiaceae bacterium]|nr:methyltransferase domain-containing protein [Polyangiaceae bacterium]
MSELLRSPAAVVIEARDAFTIAARSGAVLRFEGDSASFASAVWSLLARPMQAEDLRARLSKQAGSDVPAVLLGELVTALEGIGAIVRPRPVESPPGRRRPLEGTRVVLALSGAIAAADAPRTVLALQQRGATVRVVMSAAARRFVSRSTLEALTHAPVPSRLWSRDPSEPVPHIEIGRWADAVFVAPASATTLGRIASGDCSDLVSALVIATRAPVLVAPSMNDAMLGSPSVRRNLETLKKDGFHVLSSSSGVEVADAPADRGAHFGGAATPSQLAAAFEAWFSHCDPNNRARSIDWDEIYRCNAAEALPWLADAPDEDVRRALVDAVPPPARVLDIGCGLGLQSRDAAALGYSMVAIDISGQAIAKASSTPGSPVVFVRDDITDSRLGGRFDAIVDRGTFHTLSGAMRKRYAENVARLAGPGAFLILVHDGPGADPRFATEKLAPEMLATELPGYALVSYAPATLRRGEEGLAFCSTLRRLTT